MIGIMDPYVMSISNTSRLVDNIDTGTLINIAKSNLELCLVALFALIRFRN